MLAALRRTIDRIRARRTGPVPPEQGEQAEGERFRRESGPGKPVRRLSCRERRAGRENAAGRWLSPWDWRMVYLGARDNRLRRVRAGK